MFFFIVAGGLGGGLGDIGGPHGLDEATVSYAGNAAQQSGYLSAGGLGGLAGVGPYGTAGVGSHGGLPGQAGAVSGLYGAANVAGAVGPGAGATGGAGWAATAGAGGVGGAGLGISYLACSLRNIFYYFYVIW